MFSLPCSVSVFDAWVGAGVCGGEVGSADGLGAGSAGALVIITSAISQNPAVFFWIVINCPILGESWHVMSKFVTDPDGVVPHSSFIVRGWSR